ncbi:MAG: hypothetical protein ACM37Z_14870 [Deltaproteobacteria bacterium]
MNRDLRSWILAWACAWAIFPTHATAQQEGWLSYSPSVTRIRGRLIIVTKYGKPTYGADPDKDEKLEVPILILQTPIRIKARPESSVNNETMTNISFVQLIFPPGVEPDFKKNVNQDIVVAGTLAIGTRGGQFTDVVMTVKVVNPTGKPL